MAAFQGAYAATSGGRPLKVGAKPFCDDGNSFWALARVPAVTHGPRAAGRIRWRSGCRSTTWCAWRTCTR